MIKLEKLTSGTTVKGILPNQSVTVIDAKWHGTDVVELTYKDTNGQPHTEILFRDREPTLEIVTEGQPWSFDGDGALLRVVSRRMQYVEICDLRDHPHPLTPSPLMGEGEQEETLTPLAPRGRGAGGEGTNDWLITQSLIHQLEHHGETGAAELLAKLGDRCDIPRDLAYRLYSLCDRKGWTQEALAYNSLVTSWFEISRLAAAIRQSGDSQTSLF